GKAQADRVRSFVHDEIVKQTGFRDRGKKQANFHVLRETRMTAHLTENGFIDNASDAAKLKSDALLEKIARGHVLGAARAYGWKKKVLAVHPVGLALALVLDPALVERIIAS